VVAVGDVMVVRFKPPTWKSAGNIRIAQVARLEPLGIQLLGGSAPGCITASGAKTKFRPKFMAKVHDVGPEVFIRPATRREMVLGMALP